MNKALQEVEKLKDEILELRLRLARKEKQRKHWRRRLRDLEDHESRNILKIEAKEAIDESLPSVVNGDFSIVGGKQFVSITGKFLWYPLVSDEPV